MGRYLFRREVLACILLSAAILPGEEAPSRPLRTGPAEVPSWSHHAGPRGYSLRVPPHPLIEAERERLLSREGKTWLARSLERARPFWHFISLSIMEAGLPWELVYLPVVESAYNVRAVSRSGAVGLWQFMENSMHPWLTKNEWIDERRDFVLSTRAAIEKLSYNYSVLGDWLLALAAYNCGLNRMLSIIHLTGLTDYFALAEGGHLPHQTTHYVARFIAVVEIASQAARHGLPISWEEPWEWEGLSVDRPVSLRLLSARTGVPLDILEEANASFLLGIAPPSSVIRIPRHYAPAVREALESVPLMDITLHTVRTGDTLSALSRYYGIPLSLLYLYNPDVRPRALTPGMTLIIPLVSPRTPPPPPALPASLRWEHHTVEEGESLWRIARTYGSTVEWIALANGLSPSAVIHPGMRLKIPVPLVEE